MSAHLSRLNLPRTNVRENLLLALDTLRTHKFRSFLTILGVLIGTTTVMLGIGPGWFLSFVIRLVVPTMPSAVPLWSVVTGFAVATGVGLFFGLWPALKASRLDPIVALQYE